MLLDMDSTIGGLALVKVPFMNDMEISDILDSAIYYLKQSLPVEAEEHEIWNEDGSFLCVIRFCGNCHKKLRNNSVFCSHCGRAVKEIKNGET